MVAIAHIEGEYREESTLTKESRVADLAKLAALILAAGCDKVTKTADKNKTVFNFSGSTGEVSVSVQKREADQLHQLVHLSANDARTPTAVSYVGTANNGECLDVQPVMLSEFYREMKPFGMVVARLLQTSVVADGKTCHLELIRGRLQQLAEAA